MSTRRGRLASQQAEKRRCPSCQRGAAISVVLNPGTVSRICRWCGWESTTVLDADDDTPGAPS